VHGLQVAKHYRRNPREREQVWGGGGSPALGKKREGEIARVGELKTLGAKWIGFRGRRIYGKREETREKDGREIKKHITSPTEFSGNNLVKG